MSEKETHIDVKSGHTARFLELSRHLSDIHKRAEKLEQEGFTLQNKRDALQAKLKAAIIDDAINNTNKSEAMAVELYKIDARIKIASEQHKVLSRRRDDPDFQAMMRSSGGVAETARAVVEDNRAEITQLRERYRAEIAELEKIKADYLERVFRIGGLASYGELLVTEAQEAAPYSGLGAIASDPPVNDIDYRHWRGPIYDGIGPECITAAFLGPDAVSYKKIVQRSMPLLQIDSIQTGE